MHCKIWQEINQSNVTLQHPDEDFNTKATVVLRPNKVKWEVKHRHCWVSTLLHYLYSVNRFLFMIHFFCPLADLTAAFPTWIFSNSDLGLPTGRHETNVAIIYCVAVYTLRGSPLEGFADFLPPSRRFATFSTRLTGLWPVTPRHVETRLAWGRGKRGHSSTRWLVMGWTWGEEAPVGSHVVRRSSLEDAVEEVLQICRVGRPSGVLWGRPESKSGKVHRSFLLEP